MMIIPMKNRRLVILGSTGSIGTQALEVVRGIGGFDVCALAAGTNWKLLAEQAQDFITDGVHPGRDFIGGDFLLPLPTEKDDLVAGPHGSQTGDIDQGQVH